MTTLTEVYEALTLRVVVDDYGTRRYYNSSNLLHREAGPAVVRADGAKFWYQNNQLHCEDGPAVVCEGVAKEWWFKGVRHRINGPAVIFPSGRKEWLLNGVEYTEQGYRAQLKTLEQVHGY